MNMGGGSEYHHLILYPEMMYAKLWFIMDL
jgi:hypothetical protein